MRDSKGTIVIYPGVGERGGSMDFRCVTTKLPDPP